MALEENMHFVKFTNFKLFGKVIFSKEEIYTETLSEGQPFKIVVNQDYFNEEFDIGKNQSNDKNP